MSMPVSPERVEGPLARWAPGFVAELEGLHYAPSSAHQQVRVLAKLSAWLAGEGLDAWDLTPAVVAGFVAELRGSGYRNPRSCARSERNPELPQRSRPGAAGEGRSAVRQR